MNEIALLISTGAGVVACSAIIILILTNRQLSKTVSEFAPVLVTYGKAQLEAQQKQMMAEHDRDAALAECAAAKHELVDATKQLVATQKQLEKELKDNAQEMVKEIRSAPSNVAALDSFHRLLKKVSRVSPTDTPKPPSGTDNGDSKPPSV